MALCNSLNKSSPTNYQLIFPLIPNESTISASNPLMLNIFSSVIPGVTLGELEREWQGQKSKVASSPLVFEQWNVNFVVDSLFSNWQTMFSWMNYINNNNDVHMEEHSNYSVDASLKIMDNFRSDILEIKFVSVWPTSMSEITMSQREGDILLECNANFNYDYYEVKEIQ